MRRTGHPSAAPQPAAATLTRNHGTAAGHRDGPAYRTELLPMSGRGEAAGNIPNGIPERPGCVRQNASASRPDIGRPNR